jgi:hypothetical protein
MISGRRPPHPLAALTTSPHWGEVKSAAASYLSPAGRGRPEGTGEGADGFRTGRP